MRTRLVSALAAIFALTMLTGCPPNEPRTETRVVVVTQTVPATPTQTPPTPTEPSTTQAPETKPRPLPKRGPSSPLHHPGFSSPERKTILNALREPVQRDLDQPVVFEVTRISVQDGWAFVTGTPRQRDGSPIDYSRTRYREQVAEGFFDDGFSALLKHDGTRWRVVTYDLGATDVVWEPWAEQYGAPKAIFR